MTWTGRRWKWKWLKLHLAGEQFVHIYVPMIYDLWFAYDLWFIMKMTWPGRRAACPLATWGWFAGVGRGHTLVRVAKLEWSLVFEGFCLEQKVSFSWFRNSTCIACILPNCWDCSQSESRTHSRPKADLIPTTSKSSESSARVIVLIVGHFCQGGSIDPQWYSDGLQIKSNQPQQEIQSIKVHSDFLQCLKSVWLDGGIGNSWPHWLFSHFVNYESNIVDDGMKGEGLLLLGVPLVPLLPLLPAVPI